MNVVGQASPPTAGLDQSRYELGHRRRLGVRVLRIITIPSSRAV